MRFRIVLLFVVLHCALNNIAAEVTHEDNRNSNSNDSIKVDELYRDTRHFQPLQLNNT